MRGAVSGVLETANSPSSIWVQGCPGLDWAPRVLWNKEKAIAKMRRMYRTYAGNDLKTLLLRMSIKVLLLNFNT
jgi:hypothetical protein